MVFKKENSEKQEEMKMSLMCFGNTWKKDDWMKTASLKVGGSYFFGLIYFNKKLKCAVFTFPKVIVNGQNNLGVER